MATDDLDQKRLAILKATLGHVPFDGWTLSSLEQGARDAGFDAAMALRAFPGGVAEAVAFHSTAADAAMLAALDDIDLAAMRIRDRVATAVRTRLEQNHADRLAVSRAVAFLALPGNAPLAAKCLYRTVDAIWYACGDTATDYNFYTKRALLAGVYTTTVLAWLNDRSPGSADTWAFLDRRIGEVLQVPKLTGRLRNMTRFVPNPARFARALADLRR